MQHETSVTSIRRLPDLICLSHLRWDFVFQRPQHLMIRWAQERRVFFVEEPLEAPAVGSHVRVDETGVIVVTPLLPRDLSESERNEEQRKLLDSVVQDHGSPEYILWYYTPMALLFSRHLKPLATIYDCMDELSGFHGCPPELRLLERELMSRADVMFTGGHSLYASKREHHPNVHPFPSSVDLAHFGQARSISNAPEDQAAIKGPRIGFHGVIDERMNLDLVREIASARPDWQLILLGPVVKINPESLPRLSNIHYLGSKSYEQLPRYLAGWDVTMLPFALNEATRYISPTKTPEYLAGGKPVVSTAIHDVVKPYGELGLVKIADDAADFVAGIEAALSGLGEAWQRKVDQFLSGLSWDRTWSEMRGHIQQIVQGRSSSIKQVS